MFTFGILSTNLAYLTVVLFYAVYFLLGNKPPLEKCSVEGSKLTAGLTFHSVDLPDVRDIDHTGGILFFRNKEGKLFCRYNYIQRIPLFKSSFSIITATYCFTRFSRPPPAGLLAEF